MDFIVGLCRALANATRLELLATVHEHPGVTVRELAEHLLVTEFVASRHLHILADFGLIDARPSGRVVEVHPSDAGLSRNPLVQGLTRLLTELWQVKEDNSTLVQVWNYLGDAPGRDEAAAPGFLFERLIFFFTAYTHLRRLLILRHLAQHGRASQEAIASAIPMSPPAASRQLSKLRRRGLVEGVGGDGGASWQLVSESTSPLQQSLQRMVMAALLPET